MKQSDQDFVKYLGWKSNTAHPSSSQSQGYFKKYPSNQGTKRESPVASQTKTYKNFKSSGYIPRTPNPAAFSQGGKYTQPHAYA